MEYVPNFGGFFEGRETFGRVIAEDALCQLAKYPYNPVECSLTLVMMTSWRSVYQGLRQRAPVVRVGENGRYR